MWSHGVIGACACAAVAAAATLPDAQEALEKTWLLQVATGAQECIGAVAVNSTALLVSGCSGDDSQLWTMPNRNRGQLVNSLTGTCLAVSNFKLPPTVDNKAALQECSNRTVAQQRFEPTSGDFINTDMGVCVASCENDGGSVCSFGAEDVDWCDNATLVNERVGYVKFCGQSKAQGEWTVANVTECSRDCGMGLATYTWECTAVGSDFTNVCCDLADLPPTEGPCNMIPCDANYDDYYVLRTVAGGLCAAAAEEGNGVVLAECTGETPQLWLPMDTMWVNALTQKCLTAPQYFGVVDTPMTTELCVQEGFPALPYQTFHKDVLNLPGPWACLGPSANATLLVTVRDTDEEARLWCAAGSAETAQMNKRMEAVPLCTGSGDERVCIGGVTPSAEHIAATSEEGGQELPTDDALPATTAADEETLRLADVALATAQY